eukprot:GDKI01009342.1.p1 GENE.GDKI01009342.1~~GDKI01009342.1.p1  ORF type:complete len:127 (+),score=13.34 GDKI01009342.1:181-561(+)
MIGLATGGSGLPVSQKKMVSRQKGKSIECKQMRTETRTNIPSQDALFTNIMLLQQQCALPSNLSFEKTQSSVMEHKKRPSITSQSTVFSPRGDDKGSAGGEGRAYVGGVRTHTCVNSSVSAHGVLP